MKLATTDERDLAELVRDYKVTKSNELIQKSRYSLTLQEQKIIAYLVSHIQPSDTDLKPLTFDIKKFCRACDIIPDGMYQNLKEITLTLRNKGFDIVTPDGNISTASWIAKRTYNVKKGTITLSFDEDLKPYLLQLKEKFTTYSLSNILPLKSKYSFRLYELLRSYANLKQYKISIDNFRNLLSIDVYPQFKEFKRNVLDPALSEINTLTDIRVSYETENKGRKIIGLIFEINFAPNLEVITTRLTDISELKNT